jgi:hypothetical protein
MFKAYNYPNNFISIIENGVVTDGHLVKTKKGEGEYHHYYKYSPVEGKERKALLTNECKDTPDTVKIIYDRNHSERYIILEIEGMPFHKNRELIYKELKRFYS